MNRKTTFLGLVFTMLSCVQATNLVAGATPDVRTVVQTLSSSAAKTAMSVQLLKTLSSQVVGEALYSYSKNSASMSSLFIEETYRNQGYGSKLFRLVCTMLKKKGCSVLNFKACPFTYARNDQSYHLSELVEFFEKLGAHVVKYDDYVRGMPTTALMAIDL